MTAAVHTPTLDHRAHDLGQIARFGDLVMVLTMFASALGALAIGQYFGQTGFALGMDALILAIGSAAFLGARGTTLSQWTLVACNVALVVLHIDLGRGTIEFHFGVFVLLGLTLVYRDWRPIVLTAALFAVHHVAFDRLQAAGFAVYCTPEANLLKTMMHAIYVVAQTAIEVFLAVRLHQAAVGAAELVSLVQRVDQGCRICLDVADIPATSPVAAMLKRALLNMGEAMAEVSRAAASIEVATSEIAHGNINLGQRTEEQAANVQQTAASMDELTSTVKNTADTAGQASEVAQSASSAATQGGQVMENVVATMAGISQSSKKIVDIIGVIDGIAFQTNILALNAAVEAARAGEQGRGFAVVASEVRSLAQRSATAAKEIKSLIGGSVAEVDSGTRLVSAAGSNMTEIVSQVKRVSALINEISTATAEQSGGISQIGQAVNQLDETTQQNSALVEQSTAATESLKHQAVQLNSVVGRFALEAG